MQYIIMLLIVLGLALADYITGFIKAYCKDDIKSIKMRKGGLNKLGEIIVMLTACGLDIGIHELGKYYQAVELSNITGAITAVLVFAYITVMEIVSIFENYAEINPEAQWVLKIVKKLRTVNGGQSDENKNN